MRVIGLVHRALAPDLLFFLLFFHFTVGRGLDFFLCQRWRTSERMALYTSMLGFGEGKDFML